MAEPTAETLRSASAAEFAKVVTQAEDEQARVLAMTGTLTVRGTCPWRSGSPTTSTSPGAEQQ